MYASLISLCLRYLDGIVFEGHEMDIRNLAFETGSFDVAIDKGKPIYFFPGS